MHTSSLLHEPCSASPGREVHKGNRVIKGSVGHFGVNDFQHPLETKNGCVGVFLEPKLSLVEELIGRDINKL